MNVSILFYYLPPPNLTVPRTIEYRSPCVPRRSRVLSNPSLDTLTCIWLDVVFFVDLRPHKASVIFIYFLQAISMAETMRRVLPHRHRPARRLPQLYHIA